MNGMYLHGGVLPFGGKEWSDGCFCANYFLNCV
jgi:Transketolase